MKYNIVTVDYDDTLLFHQFDVERSMTIDWKVNTSLVRRLQKMIAEGTTVYIVTARDPSMEDDSPIQTPPYRFVKEHGLAVAGIYYTCGEFKAETLKQLGSELHFDDSEDELLVIQMQAPWITRVFIPQEPRRRVRWGQNDM